ncbi:LAO/AO transport system kinase [Sinosporangium album]|uniref:LAO/AO transport system kinase n=1 Tax=Sinosporangium album TaxID=504805 RepID=A0A1G7V5I7_9ACTN|nr:methylmalonyl Co-A mutase-associated GTPase MeaB [Sinosporangium album]SDG54828.1 LAO/AO transport system kinase [Sinosporangium album]
MPVDVDGLVAQVGQGRPRAVARVISLVENGAPELRAVMAGLSARESRDRGAPRVARVIGLTGAPGVGKSTCASMLVRAFRRRGPTVGVLAVDPSSPFTGGALLGDRVRMQEHAGDAKVFIRSMAGRGHLGGLARATPQALRVLEAAGCEVVLVETVGVGQDEVDIASLADTVLVLLAPGMGDDIQAAKAGVLEVADVFAVNKADRDGASATLRELRTMVALSDRPWRPPIVPTVAIEDKGGDDLMAALDRHHAHCARSGQLDARRRARVLAEIEAIALVALRSRFDELRGDRRLSELAQRVLDGHTDPYGAADDLIGSLP